MIPTVYVVTPVHNRRHYTEPFLRCLHMQTWPSLKIIIVDDGSTDGTSEMIKSQFPDVILLYGDGNLWTTSSWNLAIRHLMKKAFPHDYVLVLNDDLEVDEDYVENLVRFAQSKQKTLVGSVVVDIQNSDKIDSGGVKINWWTAKHKVLNRGKCLSDFKLGHYEETSTLTGRGTLLPLSVFNEIGLYDAKHFTRCGDTELPVRALKKGYQLYVTYDAVVKSYVDAVYKLNRPKRYNLRDIKNYYFNISSYSRLKYRFYFARTAAGSNPLRFASYFLMDMLRLLYHFLLRVRLTS